VDLIQKTLEGNISRGDDSDGGCEVNKGVIASCDLPVIRGDFLPLRVGSI